MMSEYRSIKDIILTHLWATHGSFEHFLRQMSSCPDITEWISGLQKQLPPRAVLVTSWMSMVHEGRNLTPIKRGGLIEPAYRSPDEGQLAARFAREGHTGVQLKRMMVPAGIHQPIRENAKYKFWLCMRLLEGGMVSEEALRLLERGELDSTVSIQRGRLLIGSRITEGVMNNRQLLDHFKRYLMNKGEDSLKLFIRMDGEKYAQLYARDWEGSYSANNARFVSGLLSTLRDQGIFSGNTGADLGAGLCTLDATYGVNHPEADITSFDLNPHILRLGAEMVQRRRDDPSFQPKTVEAAMTCIPAEDESFDFMTCSSALQDLSQRRTQHFGNHERARALEQMHSKLKQDGVLVLTFTSNVLTAQEFGAFVQEMPHFGFEVMESYTGPGESVSPEALSDMSDRSFRNWVVTLKKRGPIQKDQINLYALNFKKSDDNGGRKSEREEEPTVGETDSPSPRMHHDAFLIQTDNAVGVEITSEKTSSDIEAQDKERTYRVAIAKARALILELCQGNPEVLRNVYEGRLEFLREHGVELVHDAPEDGEKAKDLKKIWKFQLRHASAPLILPTYRIFID
jgi:SAM-dependent methyltransferase